MQDTALKTGVMLVAGLTIGLAIGQRSITTGNSKRMVRTVKEAARNVGNWFGIMAWDATEKIQAVGKSVSELTASR